MKNTMRAMDIFVFHQWYNDMFPSLVEERLLQHIDCLQRGIYPSERTELYALLKSHYEKEYCPEQLCFFYERLNDSNRERYFFYRLDIDDAFEKAIDL